MTLNHDTASVKLHKFDDLVIQEEDLEPEVLQFNLARMASQGTLNFSPNH